MDKRKYNGYHSTKAKGIDKRKNEYKSALNEAVTIDEFKDIIEVVKTKSLNGCVKSIELILSYCLGRPPQGIEVEAVAEPDNEIIVTIVNSSE
jgi:hypothetical protein